MSEATGFPHLDSALAALLRNKAEADAAIASIYRHADQHTGEPDPIPDPDPDPDPPGVPFWRSQNLPTDQSGTATDGVVWKGESEGKAGFPVLVLNANIPVDGEGKTPSLKRTLTIYNGAGAQVGAMEFRGRSNGDRPQYYGTVRTDALPDDIAVFCNGTNPKSWLYAPRSDWRSQPDQADRGMIPYKWTPGGVVEPVPTPTPPNPTPTPSPTGLMLGIWREGSAGDDFGVPSAMVMAGSRDTRNMSRIIVPNGDPIASIGSYVSRAKNAARDGCESVCIDLESFHIRQGPAWCAQVADAVRVVGLPLWYVPKTGYSHLARHWGYSFDQSARWMQANSDGEVPWNYSWGTADAWIAEVNRKRQAGYTKPIVCLMDFEERSSGGRTTPITAPEVEKCYRAGISIAAFAPDSNGWSGIVRRTAAWRKAVELYG